MTTPSKGRILVADDVEDLLEVICLMVRKMGYEVVAARDGAEAIDRVREQRPDLVIVDIMMPNVHGMDVLKEVQTEHPGVGVIVCSARSFKADVDRAMELGAFAFIAKPYERADLADAIDRFFAQRSPPVIGAATAGSATGAYAPQLDTARGYWKLWGTRGSIPVTGARYARHGGNTSCMEVSDGGEIVLMDAGSGIRDIGLELARGGPRQVHLIIGHTHWDHIQGFPFFAPAYIPGFRIDLYGAPGFGKDLESIFRGQLDRDYFPVELADMAADLHFHKLEQRVIEFGGVRVAWEYMNHPGATIGVRIEAGGRRIAYVTDNEFLKGHMGPPAAVRRDSKAAEPFAKIIELVAGCDLLIAEAQYTAEEYPKKVGWGHSSVPNACVLARESGARRWIVTHHDPMHDDEALQRKLNLTRQILAEMNCPIEVDHAFDGMSEPL